MDYFPQIKKITYQDKNEAEMGGLSYQFYDKNKVVLGKTMEAHLRPAVCFWHSFCWQGADSFGQNTMQRSWLTEEDPIAKGRAIIDAGIEFVSKLDIPYFTFHDRDIVPEAESLAKTQSNFQNLVEHLADKMQQTKRKLLWGTANLTSHPRYMAGAATNPDPHVFMVAVAQVKLCLEATHQLQGENYVLWGGREGYDTLLNTNLSQEADQLAKFLSMIVDYKHKIGFKGTLLIEPKPCEPCKHQYDFDVANVFAFLQKYHLEKEFKVNIEANHATLAGHSFSHEVAYALSNQLFGSIDSNRGDPQLGWDTDQFPFDLAETTQALYFILKQGGFTTGGFNFDSKVRRQSIDEKDLFYGHICALDTLARSLLAAQALIESNKIDNFIQKRYQGWHEPLGKEILSGRYDMTTLAEMAVKQNLQPTLQSGRQEYLEQIVNIMIPGLK